MGGKVKVHALSIKGKVIRIIESRISVRAKTVRYQFVSLATWDGPNTKDRTTKYTSRCRIGVRYLSI